MRQEVIDFIKQANEDLKTARVLIKESRWYASVFFSQQSAEKYLKALYLVRKRKSALTHNLNQIAHELNVPRNIIKAARELNPDYITTRYPDAANGVPAEQYDKISAKEHLNYAREISRWVKLRLKQKSL